MINWLKYHIRVHFGFSKMETNGVLILSLLIVLLLAVPVVIRRYYSKCIPDYDMADVVLLDSLLQECEKKINHPKPIAKPSAYADYEPTIGNIKQRKKNKIQLVDINLADIAQLTRIKGISSKIAKRILKYRNKLGGFVVQAQYQEIYGLNPVTVATLRESTFIATDFRPKQLNINTADFKILVAHPYLNY